MVQSYKNEVGDIEVCIYGMIRRGMAEEIGELLKAEGEVTLRVNSMGGDVFEAITIYNRLKERVGKVTARVEGMCASAATLIICGAAEVKAAANSLFMIHAPSVYLEGEQTASELEEVIGALRAVEMTVLETYKSKLPAKSHAQVAGMIQTGVYLTAKEALKLGLVDEITAYVDEKAAMRREEIERIRELERLKSGEKEVDALINEAIKDGLKAAQVAKYINAVERIRQRSPLEAMLTDNLSSGAERVKGSTPMDKKDNYSEQIAHYVNRILGAR